MTGINFSKIKQYTEWKFVKGDLRYSFDICSIQEPAENLIGWPRYSHGFWLNGVYFYIVLLAVSTLLPSVLQSLVPIGPRKLATTDITSSYELFNLPLYITKSKLSAIKIIFTLQNISTE